MGDVCFIHQGRTREFAKTLCVKWKRAEFAGSKRGDGMGRKSKGEEKEEERAKQNHRENCFV